MLRFIIRRQINDRLSGLVTEGLETIDAACPELERVLRESWSRQEEYDHRTVAGVEVLPDGVGSSEGCSPADFAADQFCDGHCTWAEHHPDCPRSLGVGIPVKDQQ